MNLSANPTPATARVLAVKKLSKMKTKKAAIEAEKTVTGFKGFDKGMKCRDFQYAENQEFLFEGEPSLCNQGLHFCEQPLDVFGYYPPEVGREYAHVEAFGETQTDETKTVTNKLRVKTKISVGNLFKLHFDLVFDKVKAAIKASTETVTTAGDKAHANTAGYKAHANTAGNYAHANTAGDYAHSNTAGEQAIACAIGIQSKVSAKNGWIVLTDWRYKNGEWVINNIYTCKTGNILLDTVIQPGKRYWFENGKLNSEDIA